MIDLNIVICINTIYFNSVMTQILVEFLHYFIITYRIRKELVHFGEYTSLGIKDVRHNRLVSEKNKKKEYYPTANI